MTKLPKNDSMKKTILLLILTCFLADFQAFSQANSNQFKWINGSDVTAQPSSYGATTNGPGTRYAAVEWELNGKLYLFGGRGKIGNPITQADLNDLWEFDPATNIWTWLKGYNGTTIPNSEGSYGTIGVASSTNLPPGRDGAMKWTLNNKLYLMGGYASGIRNDLWEYDPSTNNWTWIKGANTTNQVGNYGTFGVEAATNVPGARYSSASCVVNGKFYLFGGNDGNGSAVFNDLWSYNPVTNNWTFLKGNNTASMNGGNYGVLGVASSSNVPGGREGAAAFAFNNKLYLTGGLGFADLGGFANLGANNDLWSFDISTNNWTWLKGSDDVNSAGNFGTIGVANATNVPPAKKYPTTCILNNKLYLFGSNLNAFNQVCNDLWVYNPSTNIWTWIKGTNLANVQGQYGNMGVANPTNMPGGRLGGCSLWASNNKLYLFGGLGLGTTVTSGSLNDLWEYDPFTNDFTWIKGRNVVDKSGNYDAPTKPGARFGGLSWDYNNKLYLMGGFGADENGTNGSMNDLWEYNPATNVWAWLKGSKFVNSLGKFGISGVADATNLPRAREQSATWTYNNKLYLFGGRNSNMSVSLSSDTWVFDVSTNNWTWIAGPIFFDVIGIYGTMGVENAGNFPGSRKGSSAWTYNNKLYLFGGNGKGISGGNGLLNDLWEFNPVTNNWLWANGPNTVNASTITTGSPSSIRPGSRMEAVSFTDNDNAYIMCGQGNDSNGSLGSLNDLWRYNMTTKLFTFMKGSTLINQFGVYGTQGTANSSNKPGARVGAGAWGYNKKFYVFGGNGLASSGLSGYLNDLWEYKPSTNNWTWLKGSFAIESGGSYGIQGIYDPSNIASARATSSSFSANNKLYLFGGNGFGSGIGTGYLSDLWEYTPACTETYSVASGNWNTTSTWSCNQVPITTDVVNLYGHTVNLIGNGFAKNVIYNQNGNIQFGVLGKLFLNQ
jgi:N-acetylneuraminic acid mutarotase